MRLTQALLRHAPAPGAAARGLRRSRVRPQAACMDTAPVSLPTAPHALSTASRRGALAAILLLPAAPFLRPPGAAAKATSAAAPAGMTVDAAARAFREDLSLISSLHRDLVELQSCLAVDNAAECIPSWPALRARLAAASPAAGRLRTSAPVVGAAAAERRPGARGPAAALEGLFGRQISPADLERLEDLEEAAVALDDRLQQLQAALAAAAAGGSFADFGAADGVTAAGDGAAAVVAAAARMMAL